MKKILSYVLVGAMAIGFVACNEKGGNTAEGGPLADSVSMNIGELMGANFKQQLAMDSTIKMEEVIKGVEAALKADTANHGFMAGQQIGNQIMGMFQGMKQQYSLQINERKFMEAFKKALLADSTMNQEQMMQKNMDIESQLKRAQAEAKAKDPKAIKNKKDGEEFLAKKAKEAGYQKTPSGIVYKVITEGKGENFTDKDVVMVNYVGKHIDGKEFDSSKEPVPFQTSQVVPGFAEMIKLMKPGMKVEVIIPGDLAYGPEGREPTIGSNETLVFEMETVGKQEQKK
ncbi:MAG: FKBP-type peptidyl-prolyl cis-trans isomerase [Muribaculaceae bacterium]|jgi:FKBP-type peptidyl-prolyl cis-trans isomerase|nr:FKBP-type peptidyl-prolyl cis-trans isomerase [Muribaculaceae bacterium]